MGDSFLNYVRILHDKVITPLQHHTDKELLLLIQQGQRGAFNEVYERYWQKLYMVTVKRIKSSDEAKDLVQDLFFSLWTKRETLSVNSSLSAYLFAAIKYKIINYIEANIVKRDYINSLDKAVIDYDNSTREKIAYNDLDSFLQTGINTLSPKVREVFQLSRQENLSINEIAERLQVSHQTVKNQISKALKTLRIHLYS